MNLPFSSHSFVIKNSYSVFFYKTSSGQRLVPVIASYSKKEKDLLTAEPSQFSRLKDVMELLEDVTEYSEEEKNRIEEIIRYQRRRYTYLFTK